VFSVLIIFMLPGLNPKMMKRLMKQLKAEEVRAERVVIECGDKRIVIDNPQVLKTVMLGRENYQISGEAREENIEETSGISEEDVELVMSKTGCNEEEARQALKENDNDIAKAILALKK